MPFADACWHHGAMSTAAVAQALADVTQTASTEHGADPALLEGYLSALVRVAVTSRRLGKKSQASCRRLGGEAAATGVGLPALVDLYMTASRLLWPRLPELVGASRGRPMRATELIGIGEVVWRAADDALAALAEGFVEAQLFVVRREQSARVEFINDLLTGQSDVGSLVERAEPFGLMLTAGHLVAVAEIGRAIDTDTRVTGRVEDAARARFGRRGLIVTVKDGRLVCVLSGAPVAQGSDQYQSTARELADLVGPAAAKLAAGSSWRVGIGRELPGPRGVYRSYLEAIEALDIAARLGLRDQVVHARELLVYRVLLRDETAIADLVQTVLGPLTAARGGAGPLLITLEEYFAAGGNTARAARQLHLSVRAVTYRLRRVSELTGYTVTDSADRLPLHVAVTGARLLSWPANPVTSATAASSTWMSSPVRS